MRRLALAGAVLVVMAGCAAPPAAPAPATPAAAAPSTAPVPDGNAPDGNATACSAAPGTAATVRQIAASAREQPVLPAAVALFLIDARQKAAATDITDPALKDAEGQMVAAIDDLDAQGKAGLPPGGNPAQDAVKLDPTRALAAVDAVEKACKALGR